MITIQTKPAVIQMLDHRRGDLYAVISDDEHYVVRVESPLVGSEAAVGSFKPGQIGMGEDGEPAYLWLHTNWNPVPCKLIPCRTACPACGASMAVEDDKFTCSECRNTL